MGKSKKQQQQTDKINKVDISIRYFCVSCGHYHNEKNGKWGCIHAKSDECKCRKFVPRSLKGTFV